MLSKKYDNKRSILLISLFILSIIYVLLFLRPSVIDFDESYTISLINDSWSKLFYFDSLDVHPPLYYLLLKSFISITTFWTNSIPVEILFSRLFSIIISIISFIYLCKLSKFFDIKNNVYVQWMLMILLPNILGFKFSTQQLVDIRMYSLAAMFVILVFYYLIKFYYSGKNIFLISGTLASICATHTHYYAAIFSGLFLVYYLLIFLKQHNDIKIKKLCVSIFLLMLFFIPWLPIFFKQINNSNTYWMNSILELKEIIEFIIIFLLFFYPIYKYSKVSYKSIHINAIFFVILCTFIFSLVYSYSLIRKPMFQYRYMFPILLIYEFISLNILYKYLKYRKLYIYKFIIFSLLFFNFSVSLVDQVIHIYPSSIASVKMYSNWSRSRHRRIYINNNRNDFNYVTYIPEFNKQFIVPKSFKERSHIYGNNDYRITFNNVIHKLKYR